MLLKKCGELVEMHYFCKTKRKNHLLRKNYAEKICGLQNKTLPLRKKYTT